MLRHPAAIIVALIALLQADSLPAQLLPEPLLDRVGKWATDEQDDRIGAHDLGLPSNLTKPQAAIVLNDLWQAYLHYVKDPDLGELPITLQEAIANAEGRRISLPMGSLKLGEELVMPYALVRKETREPAETGRALFICTHGGGMNPKVDGPHAWPVNTREWQTQVQLAAQHYAPEGIYFVPRMVDDRKGRWFHSFNQTAFERVIQHAIAHWGVDPNRVYKLGISQGGFGTNKLVPFMPDRFAGANPMAGGVDPDNHPAANLRNVAFRNDVGEKDTMFRRVDNAIKFHERLNQLHAEDPQGYINDINVQKGRGHGIDYRPGVTWIAKHARNPWPNKLVWDSRQLHGERRSRHYWIELSAEHQAPRTKVIATADRESNSITLHVNQFEGKPKDGVEPAEPTPLKGATVRVLLHDELLDLDRIMTVTCNGKKVFKGKVQRSGAVQLRTLATYGDPAMAASSELVFELNE